MKKETEFILQCDLNSYIEQVMYERENLDASFLLNHPLLICLASESLNAGKEFFDRIRLAGKAEDFLLAIMLGGEKHFFSFSGVQLGSHVIIVAQHTTQTLTAETTMATENMLAEEVKAAFQMPETTGPEAVPEERREINVWDLMEEMSRLNNELINTKRELIRKNMELERLQKQLKKR